MANSAQEPTAALLPAMRRVAFDKALAAAQRPGRYADNRWQDKPGGKISEFEHDTVWNEDSITGS